MPAPPYRWIQVEEVGDVTVVRFTHRGVLAGDAVEAVADQLARLVDEEGRSRLLLDLSKVESVASAMLGRFVVLNRKVLAAGGRLKLCNPSPAIREMITTAQLNQLFGVYDSEQEALRTFG